MLLATQCTDSKVLAILDMIYISMEYHHDVFILNSQGSSYPQVPMTAVRD